MLDSSQALARGNPTAKSVSNIVCANEVSVNFINCEFEEVRLNIIFHFF